MGRVFGGALGLSAFAAEGQASIGLPNGTPPQVVDSILESGMEARGIPAAALVVVRGGVVLVRTGVGVVGAEGGVAVDPDSTVFGVASVGKVVTAALAVQLVDEGLLDLDAPVSRYLGDSELPSGVTMRRLLTHTAGFDERSIGFSARTPEALPSLEEFVVSYRPPIVREPGTVASYSNYGYALAGRVIEAVSGTPFHVRARTHLFEPLGMSSSSFAQPLPESIGRRRAPAYSIGATDPLPRIFFKDAPASALFTTAADMGKLIRALLNPSDGGPLESSLGETLMSRHHANHEGLPGVGLGLYEGRWADRAGYQHGGSWQDYSAGLFLAPADEMGMFVAFSGPAGGSLATELWESVIGAEARPLPGAPGREVEPPAVDEFAHLAGHYRLNRYSRSTLARLGVLVGAVPEVEVRLTNGQLFLFGSPLSPSGEGVFRRTDTGSGVAFRSGGPGAASHLFFEGAPTVAYERVAWHEQASTHRVAFVLMVLALGAMMVTEIRRIRRGAGGGRRFVTLGVSTLLVYVVGLATALGVTDPWEMQYGATTPIRMLLGFSYSVPVVAFAFAVVALFPRVRARAEMAAGLSVAYAVVAILSTALLHHWNAIGIRL